MFLPITKLNHVNDRRVSADRDTHVLSITIHVIAAAIRRYSNTSKKFSLGILAESEVPL